MRAAGRLSAAIDVLAEVLTRHRPVALALGDWGKAHRFAGSGDRSAIGNLVYDALRRRGSIGWAFEQDTARALILGAAILGWRMEPAAFAALCAELHGPGALDDAELASLTRLSIGQSTAPAWVQADLPEWLWPAWSAAYSAKAIVEGQALAARAPVDLRVNSLKSGRPELLIELAPFSPEPTPWSPVGIRLQPPDASGRTPNVQAEPSFLKGLFELQDEGSQLAALIAARCAEGQGHVLDLCAGGGGKSLAVSAALANRGQIFAYDDDKHRLAPIHDRLKRAGTRNVQVLTPRPVSLEPLLGTIGTVVIDAPCTGAGAWRRRPETKWKLTPDALARRVSEQHALLDQAVTLTKPAGCIVYITCSMLPAENGDQIAGFLARHPEWQAQTGADLMALLPVQPSAIADDRGLTLTPQQTGTDGFFIAVLRRRY
jgi:16S rRNA (cytosine967-C5)-methyltransferase